MVITATAPQVQVPSLDEIVGHSIRAMFRRFHLNRDWIIGLVGERGSGKSLGGANIGIRDFAMSGDPMWSNMAIDMGVEVPDYLATPHGLKHGGTARFQSEHLDKQTFLSLDPQYSGGLLFFDEFNLEYGESRRSVTNVNLKTDTAIQQLRKFECGLIYTVLNEAYVDVRIRENTDIFIRCVDVAMKPNNLSKRMTQGVTFEWTVYPMSPKLCGYGNTYTDTGKPYGPYQVTLNYMWDVIDTFQKQGKGGKYSQQEEVKQLIPIDFEEDPKVVMDRNRWGWLDKKLLAFLSAHKNDGDVIEITSQDFAHEMGIEKPLWPPAVAQIYQRLPNMSFKGQGWKYKKYMIPNRLTDKVKELVDA